MISVHDLINACIIGVVYLAIIPFQKIVFPSGYYSIRDILYHKDIRKAFLSSGSRLLMIAFLSYVALCFGLSKGTIMLGIGLGSFLCVWPSIYQYNLFCFFEHKIKFLYLLSCLMSIAFSIACSWFALDTLIPVIFHGKEVFLLENAGVDLVLQIFSMLVPYGIRSLISHHEEDDPYMDSVTFAADLSLTHRKIRFEQGFVKDYSFEINHAAEKYGISNQLLKTIILLELANRKSWYIRTGEYLACLLFPDYVIKHNCSLGMAQISVSIAKDYYKRAPKRFLLDMLKPEESIFLCAFYLHQLLENYAEGNTDVDEICEQYSLAGLSEEDKLSLYIASQYICGCDVSLRKFALIYMTVISQTHPMNSLPAITCVG